MCRAWGNVVVLIASLLVTTPVFASIRIAEVLYDAVAGDTGREYVVVTNEGSTAVDLATLTFSDRPDKRDRKLRPVRGTLVLSPGASAVIVSQPVQFQQNYQYSGMIVDATNFSLLNSGSTLSIQKGETILHRISYTKDDGASGDGNSLHVGTDDRLTAKPLSLTATYPLKQEKEKRGEQKHTDHSIDHLFITDAVKHSSQQIPRVSESQELLLKYVAILIGTIALIVTPLFLKKDSCDEEEKESENECTE